MEALDAGLAGPSRSLKRYNACMREDVTIREHVAVVFAKMAGPVLWLDLREDAPVRTLKGYLTRGAGKDAPWEFRFDSRVAGLREGAVLVEGDGPARWKVLALREEAAEHGAPLYWAARVEAIDAGDSPDAVEGIRGLLEALGALLAQSTLSPPEAGDVSEALERLAHLCGAPASQGHPERIRSRLVLIRQRFGACVQTERESRKLILKLEAGLRKAGLP